MATDVAREIVKIAKKLQIEDEKNNKEHKLQMMKNNLFTVYLAFGIPYDGEPDEIHYNGKEYFDYVVETFTQYNNDIYWVLRNNPDNNNMKVVNITKYPQMLQQIVKAAYSEYKEEYNNRITFRVIVGFHKRHEFHDTGYILHFDRDEEVLTMISKSFLDLNPTFSEFGSESDYDSDYDSESESESENESENNDTSQDMKEKTLNDGEVGL